MILSVAADGVIDRQIRAGVHTGEIEQRDGDVGGIAVHIATRVMAAATPGEILAFSTVYDLVVGSDIAMTDRGPHPLKGVEGTLAAVRGQPMTASRAAEGGGNRGRLG
jgi:class 3 adenylate cyclase